MVSKNTIKWVKSLEDKKNRDKHNCFIVEGVKSVEAFLDSNFPCVALFALPQWISLHSKSLLNRVGDSFEVTETELQKLSLLKTPNQVLAVFEKPQACCQPPIPQNGDLFLVLDSVQDPGNVGTIIRIANWFGIEHIICSLDTADAYGPKTVQSTMGALINVHIHVTDISQYLSIVKTQSPETHVYGTLLDGNNIYSQPIIPNGLIVMGNESKGISPQVRQLLTHKLYIPHYSKLNSGIESLNVSIATAVVCSEFLRLKNHF